MDAFQRPRRPNEYCHNPIAIVAVISTSPSDEVRNRPLNRNCEPAKENGALKRLLPSQRATDVSLEGA